YRSVVDCSAVLIDGLEGYCVAVRLDAHERVATSKPRRLTADVADVLSARRSFARRSEEHTSELQSRENLVCRLLLEKKKMPRVLCPRRTCCFRGVVRKTVRTCLSISR